MEKNTSPQAGWKWRDMSSMSRQERDTILHKAAEAAMVDYEVYHALIALKNSHPEFNEMKKKIIIEMILFVLFLVMLLYFNSIRLCIAYLALCEMLQSIVNILKNEKERLLNENR